MTTLAIYLTDTLKLGPEVTQRLVDADPWSDKGDGQTPLLPHNWTDEGGRHCIDCCLTYSESYGKPGPAGCHLACIGRPVR